MKKWFFHIALLSCFSWQCRPDAAQKQAETATDWALQLPDSVLVGKPFAVQVKGTARPESPVYLLRHGTWGTSAMSIEPSQPITLTDTLCGWVSVEVVAQGQILARGHYTVAPGNATAPLDAYLGSKSVVANGQDWAMLTAIPTDSFGNLIRDLTPIRFDLVRVGGQTETAVHPTQYGLAYHRITAQTKAGKTLAYVYAGQVRSREKELLEVANYPVDFQVFAENKTPFADARQTFKLKTDVLHDRFGNLVPDGTAVTFRCQDPTQQQRFLTAYTLGGIASVSLQNPALSGTLRIEASVAGGGQSKPLTLTFLPSP